LTNCRRADIGKTSIKRYTIVQLSVPTPSKIIAVHVNYPTRAAERGRVPEVPSYFFKPVSSLARNGDPILRPPGTESLTIEGEIALIIGTRGRHLTPERAAAHIGWCCAANDVGLADMRWADRGSNVFSKGQDGFTPLGAPVAVNGFPLEHITIRTRVNGLIEQEDSSENLIFPFAFLVADLSRFMTLEPGDVILTGTPAGARTVEPGDVVEVELEGLDSLSNPIAEAPQGIASFGAQPKLEASSGAVPSTKALSPSAAAALRKVSTATLSVQLTRRGISNPFIDGLVSSRPDLRLVGRAYTLRYVPLREDVRDASTGLNAQKQAVESIGPGDVLVIDARREAGAGTIGDILAARVAERGAVGIVTDGAVRDSEAIGRLGFPTYFQAAHPAVLGRLHFPLEINVPVACGGALVLPGDVIVGDADGVLVIPAALAEEVAVDAAAQELRESWALERVQAGESIDGIYPLSDGRRAEYEAWASQLAVVEDPL
jgi:2-keto-4-pentenoate hydratase/2-oxohepta-3-ene-1,7-dioic acid hydratase in catechol pathway/regulator of RNase E activity RraA